MPGLEFAGSLLWLPEVLIHPRSILSGGEKSRPREVQRACRQIDHEGRVSERNKKEHTCQCEGETVTNDHDCHRDWMQVCDRQSNLIESA